MSLRALYSSSHSKLPAGIGPLVEMGFSVSFGILIVAFVMACAFVPSVAALLGRRIWWPGHQGDAEPAGVGPRHDIDREQE